MIDKKAIEVKRAKKINSRIFQARAIMIIVSLCFWESFFSGPIIYSAYAGSSLPNPWDTFLIIGAFLIGLSLLGLIQSCLIPWSWIKRMINWYALDVTDHKELIRRLKVISAIIRVDLLFEGKITLWKIAKESRITKIDVEPFKECKYLKVTNENIHEIINNTIFQITFRRYIPLLSLWYMEGDRFDGFRICGTLEEVAGVDISKNRKSKRKKYGRF